jgi:hypothetical protein
MKIYKIRWTHLITGITQWSYYNPFYCKLKLQKKLAGYIRTFYQTHTFEVITEDLPNE